MLMNPSIVRNMIKGGSVKSEKIGYRSGNGDMIFLYHLCHIILPVRQLYPDGNLFKLYSFDTCDQLQTIGPICRDI